MTAARELVQRPSIDEIILRVEKEISEEKLSRNIFIYLRQMYSGEKLKKIGKRYGIGDAAAPQAIRRLASKADIDPELGKILTRTVRAIKVVRS